MKTREHFFFKISKNDFQEVDTTASIVENLRLPKNIFPPEFFIKKKNFFCAGYFVCYDQDLSSKQIVELCEGHEWEYITHLIGDFLIFYCDLASKRLFVLTDQTGKFPCYFSITDDEFIISTSFYAIVKALRSPRMDTIGALDFLHRNNNVTDRTIIQGIRQIPPATLLIVNQDGSCSLKSLINIDAFINQPFKRYSSIEKFGDAFFSTLEKLVRERLGKIKGLRFGSEISSGFDSSLISYLLKKNSRTPFVCYSRAAKAAVRDSNPKIVSEFAKKHKLDVKFIPYDHIFPFSTKEDLEWIRQVPNQIIKSEVYHHFLIMHQDENVIYFTGDGGDEIYHMDENTQNLYLRFPVQMEYFERLSMRELGIDKLLTKKGLEVLFDRERFAQKRAYPLYISTSAATIHTDTFPLSWETKMWPMTPLADPRLVWVARGIPTVSGKTASKPKQQVWEHRRDIFPAGHFIPKARGGPDDQIKRYLTERSGFVISVLENSLLSEKGWVKSSEIVSNVRKGSVHGYFGSNIISYLANLIELEYFLQQNGVKVPN
ncbi:hypothetical protein HY405_02190 [Candidatus Microgenomates bacterium]|nr:hypothetical protein [Candidatus Microgenomates bacterium]